MARPAILLAILLVSATLIVATCTSPSTITIPNQPALDSTAPVPAAFSGTGIIQNTNPTNVNDTRLLQIVVSWPSVINRTISLVSIGATHGDCDSFIYDNSGTVFGWKIIEDAENCLTTLYAQYRRPAALYNPTCAGNFHAVSNTTDYTLNFDVYVTFTDHVAIDRAGSLIWTDQVSNIIVPVVLDYPLTVNVSMSNLRIYSANSISLDVTLTAQTIQNSSPYHIHFDSLISRSFAINTTSITYYNGSQAPTTVSVAALGADDFANTVTRIQHWDISIAPGSGKCQFDGYYLINVTIYWTGVDEQGNALNASDNPIPDNQTASFGFQLDSQNFCGSTISNTISAVMTTYIDAPAVTGGHTNNVAHTGFLQGDVVYFRAVVTSLNLPVKTVSLTNLESVQGANTPVSLVASGSPIPEISYAPSSISDKPNNETDWQLTLAAATFPVNQDASLTYTFNALLTVTYDSGLTKRMVLRQSTTAGSAKATADITLGASAAAAVSASATLVLLSVFLGIYALL